MENLLRDRFVSDEGERNEWKLRQEEKFSAWKVWKQSDKSQRFRGRAKFLELGKSKSKLNEATSGLTNF